MNNSKGLLAVVLFLFSLLSAEAQLSVGSRVQANGAVNVRSTPAGTSLGTQPLGALGTITAGPQTATLNGTSYTWWNVNFDSGVDGWVASIGLNLVSSGTVDVQPLNVTRSLSNVAPGGSLSVSWQIHNNGSASAASSQSQVRISSSGSNSGGPANNVGSAVATGTIAAGATINQNTTVAAPTTPATYYVWVVADNTSVLTQTDVNNDFAVSAVFTVTDADDEITEGFDYPIGSRIRYTHASDGDGWYVAQAFGEWNGTFSKYHLGEDWNAESGGNTDCGFPVYSVADGTIVFAGIGTGWGRVVIVRHTLPNGSQVESLYGHLGSFAKTRGNVVRGEQIGTIGDGSEGGTTYSCHLHLEIRNASCPNWGQPGPGYSATQNPDGWLHPSGFIDGNRPSSTGDTVDVQPLNVICSPSSVAPGESMSVSWQIRNNGTATAASSQSQVRITASGSSWGSPAANVGGPVATGPIAAGAVLNQSTTITVPSSLAPGTYYVWVLADNTSLLDQSNVNNDYAASAAFTLPGGAVDVQPLNVTRSPSSVAPGESLSIDWQIRNNGTAAADSSQSQVRITSSSSSGGGPANNVGSPVATGVIAAGATINQNTSIIVPASLTHGTYYVWVIADNTSLLDQSNVNNDYAVSVSFNIGPPQQGEPISLGVVWIPSPNFGDRPASQMIDSIVIHTVEGSYESGIATLTDSSRPLDQRVSAHYIISPTGEITQLVDLSKRAWHATYYNDRSIGIEIAGFAAQASTWNAQNLAALENLVAYLVTNYGIPVVHPAGDASTYPQCRFTEAGLIAHSQLQPGCNEFTTKPDPGPHFSWSTLVQNVQAKVTGPRIAGIGGGGLQPPSNGQFQFEVSAPGLPQVIVQVADEPSGPWTDYKTVTVSQGKGLFNDEEAGTHGKRFYRPKP